jgi:hypothetical protein
MPPTTTRRTTTLAAKRPSLLTLQLRRRPVFCRPDDVGQLPECGVVTLGPGVARAAHIVVPAPSAANKRIRAFSPTAGRPW